MANELTLSASLKFRKGNINAGDGRAGVQLDVAGDNVVMKTQTVGTAEEPLGLGDVATPGYVFMRNLDSTNFFSVRSGEGEDNLIKVPAGGIALFMCEAAEPWVIADTAAVQIQYTMIEA